MSSKYGHHSRLNNQHTCGEGDLDDHLMSMRFFTLIRYSYELQKLGGEWLQPRFGFANHLVLIVCLISSESGLDEKSNHLGPIYLTIPWGKCIPLAVYTPKDTPPRLPFPENPPICRGHALLTVDRVGAIQRWARAIPSGLWCALVTHGGCHVWILLG